MVLLTQSLEHFLFNFHREMLVPIMFGHTELLTEDIQKEYLEWCLTDEGKQYLKGGSKYDYDHKGNIASNEARKG